MLLTLRVVFRARGIYIYTDVKEKAATKPVVADTDPDGSVFFAEVQKDPLDLAARMLRPLLTVSAMQWVYMSRDHWYEMGLRPCSYHSDTEGGARVKA